MLEQPRILHLQPAIDASRIYHQRTTKAETTNRSFLCYFYVGKNPYENGSKTVFRELKPHFFPDKITRGILLHPCTTNI